MRVTSSHAALCCGLLLGFFVFPLRCAAADAGSDRATADVTPLPAHPASTIYARQVARLIKLTWARSLDHWTKLPYGTAVVHVAIDRRGNANSPRVIFGDPEGALGESGLHAVLRTRLPAMPNEAIQELGGKKLGLDLTFDLLRPSDVKQPTSVR